VVPAYNSPLDPAHEARIKSDYSGHRSLCSWPCPLDYLNGQIIYIDGSVLAAM